MKHQGVLILIAVSLLSATAYECDIEEFTSCVKRGLSPMYACRGRHSCPWQEPTHEPYKYADGWVHPLNDEEYDEINEYI